MRLQWRNLLEAAFEQQNKLKHVIPMFASPDAVMWKAMTSTKTRLVMITFLLLVCTHDRSGQVRKEQQRLHKTQFQNKSFDHFVLWMI